MATVVLSAIGFLVGGPLGSAIGAVIGQQVDQRLLAPKGRVGPRLNDLKVQTSTYGSQIPMVFGRARLAGTVIWATDLREERRSVPNGKGAPKSTQYSYSASFAVALSARPASRIGRIWAEGKLLRGAAGDFKTPTGFRFYNGAEDQPVDPLIASAEGANSTTAFRGTAYAVFEDFALADYGNRIPSLSFEVFGDEGGTSVGAVLSGIAEGALLASAPTPLGGFLAYGDSRAAVISAIGTVVPLAAYDDGASLTMMESGPLVPQLPELSLGAGSGGKGENRTSVDQLSASRVPSTLLLTYADLDRDFETGMQHARRQGGAYREDRVELAGTLAAPDARRLAERQMEHIWASRKQAQVSLPFRYANLVPGQRVIVENLPEVWRVAEVRLENMVIRAKLQRLPTLSGASFVADPGRNIAQADRIHGPTVLRLLELPPMIDGTATQPLIAAVATGPLAGWREANLLMSTDDGASWTEAGRTAPAAIMGNIETALPAGDAYVFDRISEVVVQLINPTAALLGADEATLLSGRNAAMIGSELIQFGTAEGLGGGRYRLANFLRGRRGTISAVQSAGSPFCLLESESLLPLSVSVGARSLRVIATGVGDTLTGVEANLSIEGLTQRPLSPAHLREERLSNGDTRISWIRRSRDGWHWIDGVDSPVAEESERYEVRIIPNVGNARTFETSMLQYTYSEAARAADVAALATAVTVSVSQIGTVASSLTTSIILSIN